MSSRNERPSGSVRKKKQLFRKRKELPEPYPENGAITRTEHDTGPRSLMLICSLYERQ